MGLYMKAMDCKYNYEKKSILVKLTQIYPDYIRAFFELGLQSKNVFSMKR